LRGARVSDDEIADKVWRFGTAEKAVIVARATFHGVAGAVYSSSVEQAV
jgi:hypothetical protein